MEYLKKTRILLFIVMAVLVSGCGTMRQFGRKQFRDIQVGNKQEFLRGYRTGVSENMAKFASQFAGNDFPYFYWQAPLVQRLYMPAQVRGGVYIPGHWEYVILDPAEWREIYGYPISTQSKEIKNVPQVNFNLSDMPDPSEYSSGGKKPGSNRRRKKYHYKR